MCIIIKDHYKINNRLLMIEDVNGHQGKMKIKCGKKNSLIQHYYYNKMSQMPCGAKAYKHAQQTPFASGVLQNPDSCEKYSGKFRTDLLKGKTPNVLTMVLFLSKALLSINKCKSVPDFTILEVELLHSPCPATLIVSLIVSLVNIANQIACCSRKPYAYHKAINFQASRFKICCLTNLAKQIFKQVRILTCWVDTHLPHKCILF